MNLWTKIFNNTKIVNNFFNQNNNEINPFFESRLREMISYFSYEKDLLEPILYSFLQDGYSKNLEAELRSILINKLFVEYYRLWTTDEKNIKYYIAKLCHNIYKSISFNDRIVFNEEKETYKIYPQDVNKEFEKISRKRCNEEISVIIDRLLSSNDSLDVIFGDLTNSYELKTESTKAKIKDSEFEPYCGEISFMINRCKFILLSVEKLLASDLVNEINKTEFREFYPHLKKMVMQMIETSQSLMDEYSKYDSIEESYKIIIDSENKLSKNMQSIWNEYLTDPKDFVSGEFFRFLSHSLSGEYVDADKFNKVCCTLITDKCMPIPYGNYGYIMSFDAEKISTICASDAGSWIISRDKFIENNFVSSWQFYEKVGEDCVYYENPNLSKFVLPWDIETEMINVNTKHYGDPLPVDHHGFYSEIFMQKGSTPIAMFAKNEAGLISIKDSNNSLPIIYIDINVYREKNGLMTKNEIDESISKITI